MATKDLHNEPFDESTITKLEIFENYAQAWIPTFVMQSPPKICIFDFFAGTGYDINSVPGSPIRILEKINEQIDIILDKKVTIKIFLNDKTNWKYEKLKIACDFFLENNFKLKEAVEIVYFNKDFETLFPELLPMIKENPSLVYLDQNGIKFLSDIYISKLEEAEQTDFLYFVSSSYFRRFGGIKEFQNYLNIDMSEVNENPYKFIHRIIIDQLRKKLPNKSNVKLLPFSIKKGANIYGIIFGATHPRAIEKFLSVVWKISPTNGEANFDIDDDEQKKQGVLFGNPPLNKIESFQKRVKDKIFSSEITNNFQLLEYTFNEGHLGKHAADVLRDMKRKGEVTYDSSSPLVTYENVYQKKRKLKYSIIKK